MKTTTHLLCATAALSIVTVLGTAPAIAQTMPPATQAQSDDNGGVADIVVTAQKRSERLQDTPISITAVTGETLANRGTGTIASLGSVTPNLVYNTTAPVSGVSSGAVVFIRGVGQTDFQLTTDPGVGTYLDGVYVARSVGGVLDATRLAVRSALSVASRATNECLAVRSRSAVATGSTRACRSIYP
jgi:iron complex outermembrane receptor protein